jgi:hypothetical protein
LKVGAVFRRFRLLEKNTVNKNLSKIDHFGKLRKCVYFLKKKMFSAQSRYFCHFYPKHCERKKENIAK